MRRFLPIAAAALVVAPSAAAKLPLKPCVVQSFDARCGRLVVPESRAFPAGRKIALRVVVLPALGKPRRADPVVYLAGGPGAAASESLQAFVGPLSPLNARRDVLLVDQRGTGGSKPLFCADPEAPLTTIEEGVAFVEACESALGADFEQYGTAQAMDDVDAVRAALGYRKVNLYGVSYGATAAQIYLKRHPASVRSVILDGGTLVDVPIFEVFASNGQKALDAVAARCAADSTCRTTFPTWYADLPGLLARLKAAPVTVDAGDPVRMDDTAAASAIQLLTKSAEGAAQVPFAVSRAVAGDLDPLARVLVAEAGPSGWQPMFYSIVCNEPWARLEPAAAAADARGTFLESYVASWAPSLATTCSVFPGRAEPAEAWTRPRSSAPLLAVLGSADPQDPIGNIAGIRETMPKARLVVVPGQGHVVGHLGCMPNLLARFLERGSASGLDVSCARRVALPPFRLV